VLKTPTAGKIGANGKLIPHKARDFHNQLFKLINKDFALEMKVSVSGCR